MGWASRANPRARDFKAKSVTLLASREYQPDDLRQGDIVTLGESPTRWRVSDTEGVITLKPIGQAY